VAGAAGLVRPLRPPAPQILIVGLATLVVVVGRTAARLRVWFATVDERVIVALHLTRFVGVYFLVLYGRGQLPYAFAVPGGWGDIAVASAAIVLIAAIRATNRGGWMAYVIWNLAGLLDILFVVVTAARLGLQDPNALQALLRLPLSLLPTWLVPLILSTHVLLGVRLAQQRPAAS
jgi:hypothetical protein